MKKESRNLLLLTFCTLTIATGWLTFSVRHTAIEAIRQWQRGPIPTSITRLEFERMISAVPRAGAEESLELETEKEPDTNSLAITTESTVPVEEIKNLEEDITEDNITNETSTDRTQKNETVNDDIKTDSKNDSQPAGLVTSERPKEINLRVPFMVQAPNANWDELHGEACEEASAIMLTAYYSDEENISTEEAESRIMDAVTWEVETLGYHLDTTTLETARMLNEHFDLPKARTQTVNSIEEIKDIIATGHPVIIPAYGKALGNPYFRNGGPLYHMLIIKGYSGSRLITNDPGTRRGADYVYDEKIIWNALHDWNGGDVENGAKVIITAY